LHGPRAARGACCAERSPLANRGRGPRHPRGPRAADGRDRALAEPHRGPSDRHSGRIPPMTAAAAVVIFCGAFLLFPVEPLISQCILPWFGGSPAVRTTAMLFFQAMLLPVYG